MSDWNTIASTAVKLIFNDHEIKSNISPKDIIEAKRLFLSIIDDDKIDKPWPYLKYAELVDSKTEKIEIYEKAYNVEKNIYSCLKLIEIYIDSFDFDKGKQWLNKLIEIDSTNNNINFYKDIFNQLGSLPEDFDPNIYRIINPDVYNLKDDELKKHYLIYGVREKRKYKFSINKKSKSKCCPLFINHEISLTGGPIFLYDFVSYLKNNNIVKNPIIAEPYENDLFDNYEIQKVYHYNDPEKLLEIIKNINPVFIYSNSLNIYYKYINKFIDYWHKTYFHFHETLSFVDNNIISKIKNEKIFVVADRIKKEFETIGCTNIEVFPPFISQEKTFHIKNLSSKLKEKINDKITIGMSGNVCDRKNFHLFYQLAKNCPQYNFVWIGGDEDWMGSFLYMYRYEPESLDNFKHIPHTDNPYFYFKNLDYFFLTSKNDPCPIVVLENLLINNRIITIKDNIFYQHNKLELKENLIEIENNEETKIIETFKSLNLTKYTKNTIGEKYIEKNFFKPKILTNYNNKNNFLIFNFYKPINNYKQSEVNYFINLINNFNINNNFTYKVFININIDNGFENKFSIKKEYFFRQKYNEYFKDIINLENIELSINKGWDLNGLLKVINRIYTSYNIEQNQKLAYIHNKSNIFWREELNKIFYLRSNDIEPYDTIVCDSFFIECKENDLNRELMKSFHLFNDLSAKKFNFVGGTIFITEVNNLKNLYYFNSDLISNLTTISTHNNYWIKYMMNDEIFNSYYEYYLTNVYNSPIDIETKEIVRQGLAKNYIDLYVNFNKKGIPDLHFEHCLERYIGYLISHNKKVKKV